MESKNTDRSNGTCKLRACVYINGIFYSCDAEITDGVFSISDRRKSVSPENSRDGIFIVPGFVDVHVHLREPGFSYKETILSGTSAAKASGYAAVCAMPNLNPCPDCVETMRVQLDIIKRDAKVRVYPYAALTKGEKGKELSDMEALSEFAVAFSDDGKGVQSSEMMEQAMKKAKSLHKIIAAHCEDESLLCGGCIHDGEYARLNGFSGKGISSESEWRQVERDLDLVRKTDCSYHVCHVSTKESVALIRKAKSEGVDVTCETAPHYLVFCDEDLCDDGRFKMNPPIRSRADREALLEGICDGTVDMIATDHAPHSAEEKSRGLIGSVMGVTGLECAFPILYTHLVKKGIIPLEKLIYLMSISPSKRFSIPLSQERDFAVFKETDPYHIDPSTFISMGKSTPFSGMTAEIKVNDITA